MKPCTVLSVKDGKVVKVVSLIDVGDDADFGLTLDGGYMYVEGHLGPNDPLPPVPVEPMSPIRLWQFPFASLDGIEAAERRSKERMKAAGFEVEQGC